MTRIEIVTQLLAASIIRSNHGAHYTTDEDILDVERLADGIIAYDEAHKEAEK